MNKNIIFSVAATLMFSAMLFGGINAFAQETTLSPSPSNISVSAGSNSSIVDKIAQKFGLKSDEVKAVFDEQHLEVQKQHQAMFEQKLSQLVTNGKITETQKQAIIAKANELQTKREAERTDLENWAKQNGIDLQTVGFGFGKGLGFHHGGGMMH